MFSSYIFLVVIIISSPIIYKSSLVPSDVRCQVLAAAVEMPLLMMPQPMSPPWWNLTEEDRPGDPVVGKGRTLLPLLPCKVRGESTRGSGKVPSTSLGAGLSSGGPSSASSILFWKTVKILNYVSLLPYKKSCNLKGLKQSLNLNKCFPKLFVLDDPSSSNWPSLYSALYCKVLVRFKSCRILRSRGNNFKVTPRKQKIPPDDPLLLEQLIRECSCLVVCHTSRAGI